MRDVSTQLIGITGGIGSGKSTIARRFELEGFPVYYTDREAKRLIEQTPALQAQIAALLGEDVFAHGKYQTALVAKRVFADEALLSKLNAVVHPAVKEDLLRWKQAHNDKEKVYVESAILFESGLNELCDKVLCVTAPEEVCIARVMARDGVTEAAVRARMATQMSDDERRRRSDEIILNV